jgi:hypothetical protein
MQPGWFSLLLWFCTILELGELGPRRLELEWSILDEIWGFMLSIVVLLLVYTEMMHLWRLLQLDADLEQGVFVILHTNNASATAKFSTKSSLLVANKQSSKREKKHIHAKTVVQSMFLLRWNEYSPIDCT